MVQKIDGAKVKGPFREQLPHKSFYGIRILLLVSSNARWVKWI